MSYIQKHWKKILAAILAALAFSLIMTIVIATSGAAIPVLAEFAGLEAAAIVLAVLAPTSLISFFSLGKMASSIKSLFNKPYIGFIATSVMLALSGITAGLIFNFLPAFVFFTALGPIGGILATTLLIAVAISFTFKLLMNALEATESEDLSKLENNEPDEVQDSDVEIPHSGYSLSLSPVSRVIPDSAPKPAQTLTFISQQKTPVSATRIQDSDASLRPVHLRPWFKPAVTENNLPKVSSEQPGIPALKPDSAPAPKPAQTLTFISQQKPSVSVTRIQDSDDSLRPAHLRPWFKPAVTENNFPKVSSEQPGIPALKPDSAPAPKPAQTLTFISQQKPSVSVTRIQDSDDSLRPPHLQPWFKPAVTENNLPEVSSEQPKIPALKNEKKPLMDKLDKVKKDILEQWNILKNEYAEQRKQEKEQRKQEKRRAKQERKQAKADMKFFRQELWVEERRFNETAKEDAEMAKDAEMANM